MPLFGPLVVFVVDALILSVFVAVFVVPVELLVMVGVVVAPSLMVALFLLAWSGVCKNSMVFV